MRKFSLDALARDHLDRAKNDSAGRSSTTVYGGHELSLRQTMVALRAGSSLAEHQSPGEATLIVLRGRVRLRAGDDSWEARTGDFLTIPPTRHSLEAIEDSVTLLTVVK
jgi:quercetin dioxygenase-like cupin family protein